MPLHPRILLIAALAVSSCGGNTESPESSASTRQVPLDLGGPAAATPAVNPVAQQPAQPQPAAAPKADTSAGALELDAWHRRTLEARRVPGGAQAATLAQLQQALGGEAAKIQTLWAQRAPAGLGPQAESLAAAFGRQGTAGLESALAGLPAADPARLAFSELLTVRALELGETLRAGRALGGLLTAAAAAGYPRERILEWAPLAGRVAEGVGTALPSTEYVVASGDSYWKICNSLRKQGKPVEYGWIKLFNRRRNDALGAGDKLRIPSTPLRIECWRQLRLTAVFAGELPIRVYASSSGKPESPTPLGEFTLKICEKEPIYYPPGAPSVPYKNPENPLGERWLGFAEDKQYGLHGTNSESTIGSFETGGCVRMHNADVIELFELVGPGAKVRINP